MGRIQSSVGLISGVPIADTVDKLMALAARPRDILTARNKGLQSQQVAIGELTALTIAIQLATDKLGKSDAFEQLAVSSSRPDSLGASVTGSPAAGTYQFTPIRLASNNQQVSTGFASDSDALGLTGSLTLRFGGFVDEPVELEQLNGGAGVSRGKIRVTDRSGASQIVDLRFVQTIDDVVDAINQSDQINVRAELSGDRIRLVDLTGQTTSNLIVQEVNGGTTAASLGLGAINVAAASATGNDIVSLGDSIALADLNDGNGVGFQPELADLQIDLADGTQLTIDFQVAGSEEKTVGDLLATLNAADPAKLTARISSDGESIELVDLTSGGGTLTATSLNGSSVAEDLGLTGSPTGGVLTGRKLLGGLRTTLISSLKGGAGLGTLGQLDITDRSGATATVDLSSAVTLDDVIDAINAAGGVSVTARVNAARNGIELIDTSGGTSSNFIVANGDGTNTADALGIAVDAATNRVDSGSLDRQTVSRQTRLADLRFGRGVELGSFLITDTLGQQSAVNLVVDGAQTVGDVIDSINATGIGVQARINDTGDGIVVVDTAGGSGTLSISDTGGTAAADLGIAGNGVDVGGTQQLDGRTTATINVTSDDSLNDIVQRINDLGIDIDASVLNDGSGTNPYRLNLVSGRSGRAGSILVDGADLGIDFVQLSEGRDALLALGDASQGDNTLIASSSGNEFLDLVDGLSLVVKSGDRQPVQVEVKSSSETLVSQVQLFVDSYNKVIDKIDELTFFNEGDGSTGVLFGSHEVLRVESDLSRLVSGRFAVGGKIRTLEAIGVSLTDKGRLELDADRLKSAFQSDPQGVESFFTDETFGFSAQFKSLLDSLAGEDDSLLITRNDVLQRQIEFNQDRIDSLDKQLESQRNRLLLDFYRMDQAIAKIQSATQALQALRPLPPLVSLPKTLS